MSMLIKLASFQRARLQLFSSSPTSSVADPDAYSLESDPSSLVDPDPQSKREAQGRKEVGSQAKAPSFSIPAGSCRI